MSVEAAHAPDDGNGGGDLEPLGALLHEREEQHEEQHVRDDVDRQVRLEALHLLPVVHAHARIGDQPVDAVELDLDLLREVPDAVMRGVVDVPDEDGGLVVGDGRVDGFLGRLAAVEIAHRHDHAGGAQLDEALGACQAETRVGSGHDECAALALLCGELQREALE